jgi:WD40 repeat protein
LNFNLQNHSKSLLINETSGRERKVRMNSKQPHKLWVLGFLVALFSQSCGPVTPVASAFKATGTPASESTLSEKSNISTGKPDLSQMNVEEWASTSPDGEWIATGLVAFPKPNAGEQLAYVRLLIFSADGKTLWKVIDEQQEIGLGFPYPAPLKWSQDGKYFYFSHRVVPDGCSVFETLSDLQRVSLQDSNVEQLLPHAGLGLAMSRDESKVAYFAYGDRGLVLRDLATGKERDFWIDPSQDLQGGNLIWSPDNELLAFTVASHLCSGDRDSKTVWAESTSIVVLNTQTLEQRVLVQEDPRLFITLEWDEPNRIVITDGAENSLWHLNADSGEITRE